MILIWPSDPSRLEQIKDSIFCLSDISMSKLLAGKVCFDVFAGWPPAGITMCPQLMFATFCKSRYLLPVFTHFHEVNPNPGSTPQTPLLHVLLVIALLLTFDPHWGQQSRGWGARWCSSFSPEAISSNIHSLIYTAAGWKSLFFLLREVRGEVCV